MINRRKKFVGGGKSPKVICTILLILCCTGIIAVLFTYNNIQLQRQAQLQEISAKMKDQQRQEREKLLATYDSVKDTIDQFLPGVVCWGDSLTAGAGGNGITYPQTLQQLIKEKLLDTFRPEYSVSLGTESQNLELVPVVNMGVGGENTRTILGRNGAIPFTVGRTFTIPTDSFSGTDGYFRRHASPTGKRGHGECAGRGH